MTVKDPKESNGKKLQCLVQNLKRTVNMTSFVSVENILEMDISHASHPDMKEGVHQL